MNLSLEYRKALESDIDFLLELRMKTMYEHYAQSHLPTTKEYALQRVLYHFEKAHIILLDHHAIGLLKIDRTHDHKIEVMQLQIDPNYQGKGIGKAILKEILGEAGVHHKEVFLNVLKTNRAQKLYESIGFKTINEDQHSYIMKFSH